MYARESTVFRVRRFWYYDICDYNRQGYNVLVIPGKVLSTLAANTGTVWWTLRTPADAKHCILVLADLGYYTCIDPSRGICKSRVLGY